ncbi:MAG: type III pantothenate kinase [Lachnospiraceae bacterium]|nr:type III pantothenate kinase [Lachnospiraceae bacterium]
MILAIDIGNTNICVGCLDEKQIYFAEQLSTEVQKTDLEYAISIKNILEIYDIAPASIEGAILSSVVPPLSRALRKAVEKVIRKPTLIVGPGLKTGLNIQIDNPAQLGSDLVVDAVAGLAAYPLPLIIIDMGTATIFSVLNEKGAYIGGAILPGLHVSLDSLVSSASQLPSISLEAPRRAIGRNTVDCMKSGILFGTASMIDGMIDRIEAELGQKATCVATGDAATAILPHCRHKILYDKTLVLRGLYLLYQKNQLK